MRFVTPPASFALLPTHPAACQGPEFSTEFTCTAPKCDLVGQVKRLGAACTSRYGPVAYYDDNGLRITNVTCPAKASDAITVEPRVIGTGGPDCSIKGPKFTVVGGPQRHTIPGAVIRQRPGPVPGCPCASIRLGLTWATPPARLAFHSRSYTNKALTQF